ncbi:MAG: hypothetical protein H5T41_09685 [Methanomassiliicoccales archaeon]|nr:hypothetical protein [Methanomassiliicoccales archaeon]
MAHHLPHPAVGHPHGIQYQHKVGKVDGSSSVVRGKQRRPELTLSVAGDAEPCLAERRRELPGIGYYSCIPRFPEETPRAPKTAAPEVLTPPFPTPSPSTAASVHPGSPLGYPLSASSYPTTDRDTEFVTLPYTDQIQ